MFPELHEPTFWLAVLNIIWIDVLLSGDNALVIAMACRHLPDRQRKWGIILGALAAVVMRVIFAGVITTLMTYPYLKVAGGLALFGVAIKMLIEEDNEEAGDKVTTSLIGAIGTVMLADAVMSLDNVIAIAAIARGSIELLIFGLIVSIPLVVTGATLITKILKTFPILVWLGAALLGWIAADVALSDPVLGLHPKWEEHFAGCVLGAGFVVIVGVLYGWWRETRHA